MSSREESQNNIIELTHKSLSYPKKNDISFTELSHPLFDQSQIEIYPMENESFALELPKRHSKIKSKEGRNQEQKNHQLTDRCPTQELLIQKKGEEKSVKFPEDIEKKEKAEEMIFSVNDDPYFGDNNGKILPKKSQNKKLKAISEEKANQIHKEFAEEGYEDIMQELEDNANETNSK